jgi:hypothetical protein
MKIMSGSFRTAPRETLHKGCPLPQGKGIQTSPGILRGKSRETVTKSDRYVDSLPLTRTRYTLALPVHQAHSRTVASLALDNSFFPHHLVSLRPRTPSPFDIKHYYDYARVGGSRNCQQRRCQTMRRR